jgi:hypothetical protein
METQAVPANLPRARFPGLTQSATELASDAGDKRFTFAIETFLEGLAARRRGNE